MTSIQVYRWDQAPDAVRELREQVFIEEQGVPLELEWDDTDALADHFLMVSADGSKPLATARLYPDGVGGGSIGRLAVKMSERGQGLGQQLLRAVMSHAAPRYDYLMLSAQEYAIPFYERCGFYVCSGTYDDAGIPHRSMCCTAPALVLSRRPDSARPLTLGADTTVWAVRRASHYRDLVRALCHQTRRKLSLYDYQLSDELYDDDFIAESLSALARRHRHAEIRLLIHDDRSVIRRPHRLVRLMHRLPSNVHLRLINPDYPSPTTPFLLADDVGLAYRYESASADGFVSFNDRGQVRRLHEQFERLWSTGKTSLELRQLPL